MTEDLSIEEVEAEIDRILSEAKRMADRIIEEAKRKAEEILARPIPMDVLMRDYEEAIARAKKEAEEVIRRAEEEAKRIEDVAKKKLIDAVKLIVKAVSGV